MLIAAASAPDDIDELYAVVDRVPFTGNYSAWDPIRGVYAAIIRTYQRSGDDARVVRAVEMLSYPENGEVLADPFASGLPAVERRSGGSLLKYFVDYDRPATSLDDLHRLILAITEWTIVWAYDRSEDWPRERVDESIVAAVNDAGAYLAPR